MTFSCVVKLLYAVLLFVDLSNTFSRVYFRRQKFLSQAHTERKIGAGKMESTYGAGVWSVCHRPKVFSWLSRKHWDGSWNVMLLLVGINLLQVAVHEFGHALGLRHSRVRSAVMYPYYHGYDRDFQLDRDDINGIRFLYGLSSSNSCVRVAHNESCPLCAYCLA